MRLIFSARRIFFAKDAFKGIKYICGSLLFFSMRTEQECAQSNETFGPCNDLGLYARLKGPRQWFRNEVEEWRKRNPGKRETQWTAEAAQPGLPSSKSLADKPFFFFDFYIDHDFHMVYYDRHIRRHPVHG